MASTAADWDILAPTKQSGDWMQGSIDIAGLATAVQPRPAPSRNTEVARITTTPRSTATNGSMNLSADDFTESTLVIVGESKKGFLVPTKLLTFHSGFFKAACSERWESGREKTVTLTDEDPDTFAVFLTWVFTGDLNNSANLPRITQLEAAAYDSDVLRAQWLILAKSFILGDFLQASVFRNRVSDALVQYSRLALSATTLLIADAHSMNLNYVYQNTSSGSSLRAMVMDHIIKGIKIDLISSCGDKLSGLHKNEFYYDLSATSITMVRERKEAKYPWERDLCVYHTHPDKAAGFSCTMGKLI